MTSVLKTIFIFIALVLFAAPATAAPDAILIERWIVHNPDSTVQLDHSQFNKLLKEYRYMGADFIARFAYEKVTKEHKGLLDRYLENLQSKEVSSLNKSEQFAFWVNLYNALTISVILDHFPINTIRDINISPGFFSTGPWGAKLATIEGQELSLDDIEHGILRPIWQDPRAHYVLNCASLGCPDLPEQALTSLSLTNTLERAAKTFINHERAVSIDADGSVIVSSIYHWFSSDFGSTDSQILAHLRQYASPNLLLKLQQRSKISDHRYAWQLNN